MNPRHLSPNDLRGRRWRGLVRESTAEQARKDTTPERQRVDLRRAADELGMVAVLPLFYERVGSGEEEGVPELRRALEDGRAGQYDVLVVFHTSRFARNRAEAVTMKREFRKAGIVLYFVAQRIVSGSFSSALSEGINEVLDEYDNEQRRLWIAGGLRERQKSGRWHGRLPYGYRRALVDFADGTRGWDGALEPDPDGAAHVVAMFHQAVTRSPRDIAMALNGRGIPGPSSRPWQSRTVAEILRNPVYKGQFIRYRRPARTQPFYYDVDDPQDGRLDLGQRFPALVSEPEWRGANEAVHGRWRRGVPGSARVYPLSGVLRCGQCGRKMTGCHGGGVTRYYRCHGAAQAGTCSAPLIRADRAESAFADWLSSYRLPVDWREEIARTRTADLRSDEGNRQRKLGETLARIRNLYAWGHMPEDEYRVKERELRGEMAVMQMPTVTASLEDVAGALERLGQAWASATPDVQAAIPPLMLHAGEVADGSIEWVVRAELRPLLELCTVDGLSKVLRQPVQAYSVRYSA